jgi:hypothetical protein
MTTIPSNWVEEDRHEIVEKIVDGMMESLSEEETRRMVWDMLYDDLVFQTWPDLFIHAEVYAPDLFEGVCPVPAEESSF